MVSLQRAFAYAKESLKLLSAKHQHRLFGDYGAIPFQMQLTKATKEQFFAAMQGFETERLHIKVADSRNAEEIRKTDSELNTIRKQIQAAEHLKPVGCECDCSFREAASLTVVERIYQE